MSETPATNNADPAQQGAPGESAPDVRDTKGRFAPGQSGNPSGQKRGYASRARKALQAILEEPATDKDSRTKLDIFWRAVYARAVTKGDMAAARLIAERILPASFEADVSMAGMTADGVLDVIGCMGEDYVRDGRLPASDPEE